MSDLALTAYAKTTAALRQLVTDLAAKRERGADALEYIGMIVLAAIIIGGVFAAAQGLNLAAVFTENAGKILGKSA